MTSPTLLGSAQQDLEGRSVRDIVEYSPEQVDEAWCRKILRKILQSLELQYAMQMPHRVITPDTIVFHANGAPLLISDDIDAAPAPAARLADDLTALARVLHYAITQELTPTGPLHGRAEGYGAALIGAIDACMAPDPAQRPRNVAAVRALLGIVAPGPVAGGVVSSADLPAELPAELSDMLPAPSVVAATTDRRQAAPPADIKTGVTFDERAEPSADIQPEAQTAARAEPRAAFAADTNAGATDDPDGTVPSDRPTMAPAASATSATSAPAQMPRPPSFPDHAGNASSAGGLFTEHTPLASGPFTGIHAAPDTVFDAPPHTGMRRGQRWAIAAGGGAIVLAIAVMLFAELRDSGSYDHIVLTLPQTGDGAHTGMPAPGAVAHNDAASNTMPETAGAGASGTRNGVGAGINTPMNTPGNAPSGATPVGTPLGADRATVNRAGSLADSPATGASAGGTTLGGGNLDRPDAMTRGAPDPAGAPDNVAAADERTNDDAPVPAPAQANASYQLQIKPWGIVYVDGVDRGVSPPVKRLALTPGRHTIRITNPNYRDSILEFDSARATSNGKIIVDFNHEAR